VATHPTTRPINTTIIPPIDIGSIGGNASSHSHVGAARRVSQRNDYSNTTPSTPSLFGNAPNNRRLPITTEQRGGLQSSIVRATAVSAPSTRNRHHSQTTSMSPEPQQPLDRASSDSPSIRLPRTVATTTDSSSSGTSAAAEAPNPAPRAGLIGKGNELAVANYNHLKTPPQRVKHNWQRGPLRSR